MPTLRSSEAVAFADRVWEGEIVPALSEYIRIPNKSPAFEPDWRAVGHMDRAVAHIEAWCRRQAMPGLSIEVVRLENRTPVILMELPGAPGSDDTVLLYGRGACCASRRSRTRAAWC